VHAELDVNITRGGVVILPVVPVGPPECEVARRVARGSLIFFQELLEVERLSDARPERSRPFVHYS
jgi:hypothetical protein